MDIILMRCDNELYYFNGTSGYCIGIPDSNCKILFTVQERTARRLNDSNNPN